MLVEEYDLEFDDFGIEFNGFELLLAYTSHYKVYTNSSQIVIFELIILFIDYYKVQQILEEEMIYPPLYLLLTPT